MLFPFFRRNRPKYHVIRHHNYWPYDWGGSLEEADIVFTWFEEKEPLDEWRRQGKKIISYEHGFGSYYGYGQVGVEPYSDKYLSSGEIGKSSLVELGVPEKDILVIGNAHFDDIKTSKHNVNKALFVAQHWMYDVSEYNQETYDKLIKSYPELDWTARTIDKSGGVVAEKIWSSNVEDGDLFQDIKMTLPQFDYVFTPRYSTFCVFAEFMGIPVYITDEHLSFAQKGEKKGYVVPNNQNFIEIGDKLPTPKESNLEGFLKRPSMKFKDVLKWCVSD